MNHLNAVINVINSLRAKGLLHYAVELDGFLRRNAQELGEVDPLAALEDMGTGAGEEVMIPMPEQQKATPEASKMLCTLYYQFEKWHAILDRELPRFDYFGKPIVLNLFV